MSSPEPLEPAAQEPDVCDCEAAFGEMRRGPSDDAPAFGGSWTWTIAGGLGRHVPGCPHGAAE